MPIFLDPNGDILTGWQSTGASHYTEIDDAVRSPSIPHTSNYIFETWGSGDNVDSFNMETTVEASTTEVTIRIYAKSALPINSVACQIYSSNSQDIISGNSPIGWYSVTFNESTDPSLFPLNQASLDALTVKFTPTTTVLNDDAAFIYAMYAEIEGDDSSASTSSTSSSTSPDTTSSTSSESSPLSSPSTSSSSKTSGDPSSFSSSSDTTATSSSSSSSGEKRDADTTDIEYAYGMRRGGKWFYSQRRPGTAWVDRATNEKGWTLDFNLHVVSVENDLGFSNTPEPDGLGIYVNDGTRFESIYFLSQEVVFSQADEAYAYDTTEAVDYRLIGKNDQLRLYGKKDDEANYALIAEVKFTGSATDEINGHSPSIQRDSSGDLHAVWHDDSRGNIYYSKFANSAWSVPVPVVSEDLGATNPDLVIDSNGVVHVVFESRNTDETTIGYVFWNSSGWSTPELLAPDIGESKGPKITVDDQDNIHIVFEDHRRLVADIYWIIRRYSTQQWESPQKVSQGNYGALRPSITPYESSVYVSWSQKDENDLSLIQSASFNALTNVWSAVFEASMSGDYRKADYSDILATTAGRIFIAWHDDTSGDKEIYSRKFNLSLQPLTDTVQITQSYNESRYPVLSEHLETNDVYIVWEDLREDDPALDPYVDPYKAFHGRKIFVAYHDYVNQIWYSSGQGSFDVQISPPDERDEGQPAVSDLFSGRLHILYESWFADVVHEYIPPRDQFSSIHDAVYDLSRVNYYFLVNDYGDLDLKVSDRQLRKEIRFGDFSNTLSTDSIFKDMAFYLEDALEPLIVTSVSGEDYDIGEIQVMDVAVNNYGDVWLGTLCGLRFYNRSTGDLHLAADTNVSAAQINAIAFDNNNVMFVATPTAVFYSTNHTAFLQITSDKITAPTSLAFNNDNKLIVGNSDSGVAIITMDSTFAITDTVVLSSELPSVYVTSVAVDNINNIWIGTRSGLSLYRRGKVTTFTKSHGLPSNRINDIAIRNTAIRYIATSNGVSKMLGTSFENLSAHDSVIYNNNVKSVAWQEPNVLWASTLSSLNQVVINDQDDTSVTTVFTPNDYTDSPTVYDDLKTYHIVTDDTLNKDSFIQVFLNGNMLNQGYTVSPSKKMMRFETPLLPSDVIDVVAYDGVRLLSSFSQEAGEKIALGSNTIRIKRLDIYDGNIFAITEGDQNELKISDEAGSLPFDRVVVDTTPPIGEITIDEQIDASNVRVIISKIGEQPFDELSGVDRMVVSNFQNFTTDGTTDKDSIPFSTSTIHDIGIISASTAISLEFSATTGSTIAYLNGSMYAGTANPGKIYKFAAGVWTEVVSFGANKSVDMLTYYSGKIVVGVSSTTGPGEVYSSPDGVTYTLVGAITGGSIHSAAELNSLLYIGTGNDGKVYLYNGTSLALEFDNIGSDVRGITAINNTLFATTGSGGHLYTLDPDNDIALIIHTDTDAVLTDIANATVGGKEYVFAGTSSEGKVIRSLTTSYSFNDSFQTTSSSVNAVRSLNGIIYIAIGDTLHILRDGTWTWQYTHSEDIEDVMLNEVTNIVYIVSDSNVTSLDFASSTSRNVYLKLVDKAGNESVLFDDNGALKARFFDTLTIDDIKGLAVENKILEIDNSGNTVFSLSGSNVFYSADRIDEERGIYLSEIFDGTNDAIKWDNMTWIFTTPSGTAVEMYLRSSDSSQDILTEDWRGPFTSNDSSGLDLSSFAGRYIQFKTELSSSLKNVTPTLSRVTLRLITSDSIHFFTTNFAMPSRVTKGIITTESLIPVAADIVIGVNTTDSVEWADYQIVDENRIFNVDQHGLGLRIGAKMLSPSRSTVTPAEFAEYGPYDSSLFINTVDVDYTNISGSDKTYHFRVSFYNDVDKTDLVYQIETSDDTSGFSTDGAAFPSGGELISNGSTVNLLYSVPNSVGLACGSFYFVTVEANDATAYETISDGMAFTMGCSASFVDVIDFDFTNNSGVDDTYHFRIRAYDDVERTSLFKTFYSGNDRTGWLADNVQIPDAGEPVSNGASVNIVYRPDLSEFASNTLYYLIIDAYDGDGFQLASNSYTFQAQDFSSLIYCGGYVDVPVLKNLGILFELEDGSFVTLNI